MIPELTLVHYTRAVSDSVYLRVLGTTLEISLLTTLVCLAVRLPDWLTSWRAAKPRYRGLLMGVVALSLVMSLLVKNYSWTILLQDTGVINTVPACGWGVISKPLPLMYNLFGVLVGMVQMLLPFMILPLYSVLHGHGPHPRARHPAVLGAGTAKDLLACHPPPEPARDRRGLAPGLHHLARASSSPRPSSAEGRR